MFQILLFFNTGMYEKASQWAVTFGRCQKQRSSRGEEPSRQLPHDPAFRSLGPNRAGAAEGQVKADSLLGSLGRGVATPPAVPMFHQLYQPRPVVGEGRRVSVAKAPYRARQTKSRPAKNIGMAT